MADIRWSREIPLRYEADVLVAGGGVAGVCAACAAARGGASVLLVERFAVTGGNATAGGVANWSGETRGQGAVFDRIIARQEEFGAIAPYPGPYRHFTRMNRVFDHEILAVILQELLLEYGVKPLLHTRFVDVRVDGAGELTEAILCGMGGIEAARARVFIDCTGDACVARAAGFAVEKGDGQTVSPPGQLPPSLMFFLRERPEPEPPQLPGGWFQPVTRSEDLPMTSVWPDGPGGKAIKLKIPGYDSTETEGMTALEIRARRRMFEVLDYFQRVERKPWRLGHCSPIIGLREGARVVGDYILAAADLREGRKFADAVARGVFFLDGMTPRDEKRTYLLTKQEQQIPPYQIPLRCLIARDGKNLLMAGRCLSADQHALSSARVMPTCAMMGQAAGILAAKAAAAKTQPRAIDPREIRRTVEAHGAILETED